VRFLVREDNTITIRYLIEKIDRALEFCDYFSKDLEDPDKLNMFLMIREDLEGCIAPDKGLTALHKTYQGKHAPASELEVIIRNVKMKLKKYQPLVPPTRSPPEED